MKKILSSLPLIKSVRISIVFLFLFFTAIAGETLTNQNIISLTTSKVSKDIIIEKVKSSPNQFDLSATGVIGLKNSKVSDQVVEAMMLASKNLPMVTNKDVIDMQSGGVSKDIIIKKIQYSKCNFDTNTDAMIALKTAKVPDSIQKAMMSAENSAPEQSSTTAGSSETPSAPALADSPIPNISKFSENGIYVEEHNPSVAYSQLEPTTTNQSKGGSAGEYVGNRMTYGISGSTNKVGLANKSANLVVKDARPVFYFIFSGKDRKEMNTVGESTFSGVASPNDFVLVQAKVSAKGRQITIGKHGAFTNESGFTEGTVQFKFKKISSEMYRVYLENDLPSGEYAFYYNKGSTESASLKLYDFSVQNGIAGKKTK